MPTLVHSLTEIDPLEWDRLAGENAFATHGWLLTGRALQRHPVEPLYFIHRENGVTVAAAVCYVASRSDDLETLDHSLGTGYYDRPIARRIAEEAGVPRENFGRRKMSAGADVLRTLNAESQADFEAFLASEVPAPIRRRLDDRPLSQRIANHRRLKYFRTHYTHLPMGDLLIRATGIERLHLLFRSLSQYRFHWGVERTRERYR